jgi:hypothetical protein
MDWSEVIAWLNQQGWEIFLIIAVAAVVYFLLRRLIPIESEEE